MQVVFRNTGEKGILLLMQNLPVLHLVNVSRGQLHEITCSVVI